MCCFLLIDLLLFRVRLLVVDGRVEVEARLTESGWVIWEEDVKEGVAAGDDDGRLIKGLFSTCVEILVASTNGVEYVKGLGGTNGL